MFLKSLEIRGFKSFADKTQLKFKKGVTAVVGPNGSGKSNVSDSVRWVLGEQSVKTLRGGKMEDVIFAGTQYRKPLGLAQVSLTLDNSDNSLDTDYSEVTITRRIFRSGETEYLINNRKCRLKDINTLFMDTGIGKEGYSLIGQGKIEAILSGRPEERRALLEEAAGIVKFKSRKEEAEKKLSNTEGNLVRIRDIISTYEERLEPLKIDREKALKYNELADELKIEEVSLLVNNIENIDNDIKDMLFDIEKKKSNVEDSRRNLESDKLKVSYLENKIEELENKNNANKSEYYRRKDELNNNLKDLEVFKERIKNLEEIIEKETLEIDYLENTLKDSIEIKSKTEKDLKESLDKKAQNDIKVTSLENMINSLNIEIKELDSIVEEFKDKEFEFLRRNSEINNEIILLNKEILNREERALSAKSELDIIQANMNISLATISELKTKRENSKKLADDINESILDKRKTLSNLNSSLTKKENFIREIYKSINVLEGKIIALKDLEKSYEGYQLSVKRLMENISSGKISYANDTKVLGEIFTVDKQYETAIEIALSSSISNVITKDEKIAKSLIEYLKKNSLGRATFLPLSIIKGNRLNISHEIKNVSGFLGLASDLLNFNQEFKEVMDYSLGRTIIAKDMESALKISKIGNYKLKIVTLEGEVISPGGALTGGSIYKKNNLSILGRKRELLSLQDNIGQSKEKYLKEQEESNKIKDEISILDEEVLNLNDDIHRKKIDIAKYESEIKSLESESIKIKNTLEICKNELVLNKNTLNKLNANIKIKNEALDKLKEENSFNKSEILNSQNLLAKKKESFDSIREDLTNIKISKASLDEVILRRESDVKREDSKIKDIEYKIKEINAENKDKQNQINSLNEQIKKRKVLIDENNSRLAKLDAVFKEDEINKISLKEEYKIKTDKLNDIIDNIRILENELNKKEVLYAKIESEKESYYIRLNEELNLTLAQAKEIAIDVEDIQKSKDKISKLKIKISSLGTVNLAAIVEYEEVSEKYEFMANQEEDLNKAKEELLTVIREMTANMQTLFKENFSIINKNFNETFKELFKGGNAELILGEGDELTSNIEIRVQPPGKKLQNINLMSGGEKVLSAIALLFAILKMRPTPFCILDEIEAALDDANVYRYAEFLKKFSENIQFIVITHRKGTMEASDIMYGITMEEKGISKVVSVDLTKFD